MLFFFQAEDGIRDAQESRGLGDVYKRQFLYSTTNIPPFPYIEKMMITISIVANTVCSTPV